jgi:hypothetical protein
MNNLIPYNAWVKQQHKETESIGKIYGKRAKDTDGSLQSINTESREVFLTFDLCPNTIIQKDVVDYLRGESIECTIFCSAKALKLNVGFEDDLKGVDYTIEGHGDKHYTANEISEVLQKEEIDGSVEYIKERFGNDIKYYRFPNGISTPYSSGILRSMKIKAVSWFNGIMDSRTRKSTNLGKTGEISVYDKFDLIDPELIRGKIYLFHLGDNGDETIQYLKEFVEFCKTNKYSIKKLR